RARDGGGGAGAPAGPPRVRPIPAARARGVGLRPDGARAVRAGGVGPAGHHRLAGALRPPRSAAGPGRPGRGTRVTRRARAVVPMVPALFAPMVWGRLAIIGWMVLFALLGLQLGRAARDAARG